MTWVLLCSNNLPSSCFLSHVTGLLFCLYPRKQYPTVCPSLKAPNSFTILFSKHSISKTTRPFLITDFSGVFWLKRITNHKCIDEANILNTKTLASSMHFWFVILFNQKTPEQSVNRKGLVVLDIECFENNIVKELEAFKDGQTVGYCFLPPKNSNQHPNLLACPKVQHLIF